MADILREVFGQFWKRFRDVGDGTHAEVVALAANSGIEVLDVTLPIALYNDIKVVTAAGTAEALAGTQTLVSGVRVKALLANTGLIYVGDSAVDSTNGYQLASGESVFLEIDDLATVYVDSAVNGEGVSFVGS